jgi:CRP-like cAMP-binding protein
LEASDARDVLVAIPLFGETLNDRQLEHLAAQCRLAIYPTDAVLMAEGDFADAMFAIIDGEVEVAFHDRRGGEHEVATLGPGEIVGEMALLTGMRRTATAVALGEVAALEISKVTFEELFARAPDLIDRFSSVIARRQSELDRIAADADASAAAIGARIRRFFGGG